MADAPRGRGGFGRGRGDRGRGRRGPRRGGRKEEDKEWCAKCAEDYLQSHTKTGSLSLNSAAW